MRIGEPACPRLAMNVPNGTASSSRLPSATARPRRQESINISDTAPTNNGNQPPAGILCALAETNVVSIDRNSPATGITATNGQPHTLCATIVTSSVVTSMSPATAIPYALARESELRNPNTSPRTATASSQLI